MGLGLATEKPCYIVMSYLIGWAHTWNDPCNVQQTDSLGTL